MTELCIRQTGDNNLWGKECPDPRCNERSPATDGSTSMATCKPLLDTRRVADPPANLCGPAESAEGCAPDCCQDSTKVEDLGQMIVDAMKAELQDEPPTAAFAEAPEEEELLIDEGPPESILAEAERIVNGPRRESYGHPAVNFARIAHLWNGYLRAICEGNSEQSVYGILLTPQDVCQMMIQLKQCRIIQTPTDRDGHVDIAGYAQCSKLIAERDEENAAKIAWEMD